MPALDVLSVRGIISDMTQHILAGDPLGALAARQFGDAANSDPKLENVVVGIFANARRTMVNLEDVLLDPC